MTSEHVEDFKAFVRFKGMHVMGNDDVVQFGEVAGNGYPMDYAIFPYFFEEENSRDKIVSLAVINYVAMHRHGVGFSPEDTTLGSILILPPENRIVSASDFCDAAEGKMEYMYGADACRRMSVYEKYCGIFNNKYSDDGTWYIENLTVAKGHQGQGVGGRLMRVLLEYLDSIDASCFLETHRASNIKFYEHFGFELVEVGMLPDSDFEHYAMLRKRKSQREH